MKKIFSLVLLSYLAINTFAQSATAFVQDKIAKGTSVKILEIGSSDTYYSERADFVGKDATALGEVNKNSNGFYSGTLETTSGRTCFFSNVKLFVNSSVSSKTTLSKSIKFVTGTIKSGTTLYVAEISVDDSYYSDRFEKVGKKGKVSKEELTMKDDGYYAGDFMYDDGTSDYFYKVKFSKEPVDKLVKPASSTTTTTTTTSTNTTTNSTKDDYSDLAYLFGGFDSDDDYNNATNDETIKPGDKVEITGISSEDSYYDDRADYIGKKGIAGSDIEFQYLDNAFGGTVKFETGMSPNFYLVKLKKIGGSSSIKPTNSSSASSSIPAPDNLAKNTKVLITDVGPEDSYVTSKDKYIRKKGKAVDGLTGQSGGYYSGKIVFDDGTDAYFFNVKVLVTK